MGRGRSIRRAVLALGAAILACVVSLDASAFCRTMTCDPLLKSDHCRIDPKTGCNLSGAPLKWPSGPIPFRFYARGTKQLDDHDARTAVRSAFARWSEVKCAGDRRTSLRFEQKADISADSPANPHLNGAQHLGIYFRDDAWTAKDADSTLALTTQSFGKFSGTLDDSDIEINTATESFVTDDASVGVDLEAVVTHEVGHYIGLSHSKEPDSIMVASYCESGKRCGGDKHDARELSADDQAAVCEMFPPSRPGDALHQDPSASSCSAAPSDLGGSSSTWLPFAGAAFVLVALRRRQQ